MRVCGRVIVWALLASTACACQASVQRAFAPGFPDNDTARTARVLSRLGTRAPDDDAPWAIATVGPHGAALVRLDPHSGAALWKRTLRSDIRPLRLGDRVLITSDGALLGLDFADGATRFELPLQSQTLTGVARSGERIFAVSSTARSAGVGPRSTLTALNADDGHVLWRHEVDATLGEPAAGDSVVIVPFQQQALVALDAATGDELARLRTTDDVFRWVRVLDGQLLAGDRSIRTIGRDYAGVHGNTAPTPLPLDRLATSPTPYPPTIQPVSVPPRSAGRMLLQFALRAAGSNATLADDRIYQVFYRHVLALDAAGSLQWVRVMDNDIVAASGGPDGLSLVTDDGRIARLAADDGELHWAPASNLPITAAALGGNWALADAQGAALPPPVELRQSLVDMALDRDDRLLATRALAVRELSTMPQPEVTRDLLHIYQHIGMAPQLRRDLARVIVERRTGAGFLLAALDAREDFLEGTKAPPLEVLAPALAAMDETRAYPLLARHLFDPGTPATSLRAVIEAMGSLGGVQAREPLWTFLRRYHADSSLALHPDIPLAAARTLMAAGDAQDATALRQLIDMHNAQPALATQLAALLPPSAPTDPAPLAETGPTTGPQTAPTADQPLPLRLSKTDIHAVFSDHEEDLRHCAEQHLARQPQLTQVRIAMVLSGDGRTRTRSYLPDDAAFVACLDPRVASYRFGRFRTRQQTVRYVVSLLPPATADTAAPADDRDWWAPHQQRSTAGRPGPRWWHDRNALTVQLTSARQVAGQSAASPSAASASPPDSPSSESDGVDPGRPAGDGDPSAPAPAPTADAWWQPVSSPTQKDAEDSPPPESTPP